MLSVQEFGGLGQAGLDVFRTDVGIVVQDLLLGPPGGQKIDNELDGKPGTFDDWFANNNLGVDRDAFAPVHCHRTPGYRPRRLINKIAVTFAVSREFARLREGLILCSRTTCRHRNGRLHLATCMPFGSMCGTPFVNSQRAR